MIKDPELAIDVSLYDDHLDIPKLQAAGVAAVVVRSGSGLTRDKRFLRHGEACAKYGMPLMAYHWDDILYDPSHQADFAVENIKSSGLPVRFLWADQEQWWSDWYQWSLARRGLLPYDEVPRASAQAISTHNQGFARRLQQLWKQSGIYTNYGFVGSWAPPMSQWLQYYVLWVPHYGKQPLKPVTISWEDLKKNWLPSYSPLLPAGANPDYVMMHQFSGDRFYMDGVFDSLGRRMLTDLNTADHTFLAGLCEGTIPTLPTVEPTHPITDGDRYVVTVDSLCVRSGPGTSHTLVGGLVKNQTVTVADIIGGWAKLKEPFADRWCYALYLAGIPGGG